jgi:hypothetical protein
MPTTFELNDVWAVTRRYMSLATVAQVCEDRSIDNRKNLGVMSIRPTLPGAPNCTTPRTTIEFTAWRFDVE